MQGISAEADPILKAQEAPDADANGGERELRKWCLMFAFQCSQDDVYGDDIMRLATTLERYVRDGHIPKGDAVKAV